MFQEESDEDSIATDSTLLSERRDDYPVERILCEQWNPRDQCTEYLIKWEGYPLEIASYEPATNFIGNAILPEWEERKARIEQGLEQPFNEDEWYEAVGVAEAAKAVRHSRRQNKKRRQGKPVYPDETQDNQGGDESCEEDEPRANRRRRSEAPKASPAKKKVKRPEVQRKGVAQKITKRRARSASSISQSKSASEDSRDSLLEEVKRSGPTRKSTARAAGSPRATANASAHKKPSMSKRPSAVNEHVVSRDRRPLQGTQHRDKQSLEQRKKPDVPPKAVVSSVARKSAPRTGIETVFTKSAKAPSKGIFANWAADKKPRERPRVSGETPKDSDGSQFTTLAMQNRYQKYSRNEKAPDVSALTILDPKTGKPKLPPLNTGANNGPSQASASPAQLTPLPANDLRRDNRSNMVQACQTSASVPRVGMNETACYYWLKGSCRYSAADCKFAHYDTGTHAGPPGTYGKGSATYTPPTESTLLQTCWWWRQPQGCSQSDEECQFAHKDTGLYAPRPATLRQGTMASAQQSGSRVAADIHLPPPPAMPSMPPSGKVPQKQTTCWYWLQPRGCNKPENVCEFAHWDTGVHAGPPGSYREAFEARERQPNQVLISRPPPPAQPVSDAPVSQLASSARAVNPTASAALLVCLSDTGDPLMLSAKLEVRDLSEVEKLAGSGPTLRATRIVMVDDFKNIISDDLSSSRTFFGGIHINPVNRSDAEAVTEMLNRYDSALVAAVPGRDVCAIIWPCRAERWKYLEDGSVALSDESVLHFRMFPRLSGFAEAEISDSSSDKSTEQKHHAVTLGEVLAGLDAEKLHPKKDGNKPSDRAVFLMFPQTHTAEIQVCAAYFQGAGLKVYHSGTPGAWDHFQRTHTNACSIVLHPDVPICEIPGLHNVLSMTTAKFFTLGINRIVAEHEDREPIYGCDRMFPHGNVAFITDDVFVHHPEKATEVIKAFLEANRYKPEGGENNRIATRPGVKAWVLGLVMEKTAQRGRQDERWMQLYDIICRVCPPEDEDPLDEEGNPCPTSNLISIPPEHLPSFDDIWEKDEAASTDYIVNWFAGWAILNASKYRRFVVCNEPKDSRVTTTKDKSGKMVSQVEADPRGWARKYQHLGVALPSRVAGMLNSKWKK